MTEQNKLTIDVVSDVVCPWCFLGMKRLENALASLPDIEAEVRWRPFQLDPTIPPEGKERKAYMLSKFNDETKLKQAHANLVSLGAVEGISFDFDAITVAPNTLDAHRVIRWAAASGAGVQDKLARALFSLYFEQGKNVGDHAVLVEAARQAGMDAAVVEALLATDSDHDEVTNEIVTASRMGITGVPCFLLDGKYAVMGAQDSATLADAIRQVAAEKAAGEPVLN
ncbi:DsbA family oxidoreductase [Aminobacter niigataensis]|uniref:DsbA family oxidoreductase n=1 Tax=Aminobacter niigataensis TaxID=83265 RepID=UPI0024C6CB15|nr:DsbA family protein [Aminobacter niigataensis]CAI2934683.1 DSBA-like thioredoxin family protein [Aminobacter niigataensis]